MKQQMWRSITIPSLESAYGHELKISKKRQASRLFYAFIISLAILVSCKPADKAGFGDDASGEPTEIVVYNNPPADGFDIEGSTPHAIVMADQIMNAMGGREKWDQTNVISWNFLGVRTLLWDKANNKVRIDIPSSKMVIALDLNDMTGSVWKDKVKYMQPDSISKYLEQGRKMWINDSYWLVMPFKLKDSGVTLTYVGEDTTRQGARADVLRLTFKNVGVTPDNAYDVWVDFDTRLIQQWAYYKEATQEEPNFVLPWTDYKDYDGLLLSGERGDSDLTEIKVLKTVPKGAFDNPDPLTL
ncbi:MAG: hypothetical protein RLP11_01310 [Marinoscillum sp.]|uniref:hypothetical protein n=1 Tax=Marinoscillum sp. TaxID=2024838 RepID=UPI0033020B5E